MFFFLMKTTDPPTLRELPLKDYCLCILLGFDIFDDFTESALTFLFFKVIGSDFQDFFITF